MASNWPTSPRSAWAVGMSKAASVAPARLSAVPKRARPVMVNVRVGPLQQNAHLLAHREVVLLRRAEVHDHVVGRSSAPCPGRGGGRRSVGSGSNEMPRVGAPPVVIGLAVGDDELRVAGDRSLGGLHAGHGLHRGEERLGDGIARGVAAAAELGHAAHLEVDVLVDVPEQRVERVVQGVGEHERPGDERHPEHDGQRGERQAQLVGEQPLDGDLPHVRRPASGCARGPSRRSGRRARRRRLPSARKTTRSA